jgi:hypothetical protein
MANGFVYLVAVMDWFSRRVLSWRLSLPQFAEKLTAIVGPYVAPPEHAVALPIDEKTLDRTQPGLPNEKAAAQP